MRPLQFCDLPGLAWLALIALPAALALPWMLAGDPWDPDETRYLEVFREMHESRDFVVPRFNGASYLEKPPLYYWLGAASFSLFGIHVIAGRLVSVLAAAGTVLATAWIGQIIGGRRRGFRAGLLLSVSPFFTIMAPIITLDMTLTFWITVAVAAMIHGLWAPEEPRPGRGPAIFLAYLLLALGFLTKGPVALVLPAFIWIAWRSGGGLKALIPPRLGWGALIFLAAVLPWFVLITRARPEFPEFFFFRGNLARLLGEKVRRINIHRQPFYIYLPIVFGGAFPWSLYLAAPWRRLRREIFAAGAERLFWSWLLLGLLFFSLVPAKLPTYVLPLFPPLALLAARRWEELDRGELPRSWQLGMALGVLAVSAIAMLVFVPLIAFSRESLIALFDWRLVAVYGATAMLLAGWSFWSALRGRSARSFLGLLLLTFLNPVFGAPAMRPVNEERSFDRWARKLASAAAPEDILICADKYIPILSFHLRRPALIFGDRGELEFASRDLGERPDLFIDENRLAGLIRGGQRVFITIRERRWRTLKSAFAKDLHLLGLSGDCMLFCNRDPPWPEIRESRQEGEN